jgi:hypothetical protein
MSFKLNGHEPDFAGILSTAGTYTAHELNNAKSEAKIWKEIANRKDSEILALKEKLKMLQKGAEKEPI